MIDTRYLIKSKYVMIISDYFSSKNKTSTVIYSNKKLKDEGGGGGGRGKEKSNKQTVN